MKKFRRDYGVYTCPHIFRKERPILLVIRDPDGDWQFLCGQEDDDEECHLVGVGHLLDEDPSLNLVAELGAGTLAERDNMQQNWNFYELDEDD